MAHLFQVDSVCSCWFERKRACCDTAVIRDSALFAHHHHRHQKAIHHSFSSRGALLQPPPPPSSFSLSIFCSNSNTQYSESQARKQSSSRTTGSSSAARRPARTSKSDAELRSDLQLFLSSQGLPPDTVPSTKELSNGGREDLAKIVRRRGYKAVHKLLTDSDTGPSIAQKSNAASDVKDSISGASKITSHPAHHSQKAELDGLAMPVKSGSSNDISRDIKSNSFIQKPTDRKEEGRCETSPKTLYFMNGSLIAKQANEQLHKRASEFVRTGQFDHVQDSDEDEDDEDNFYDDSSDEEERGQIWDGHKSAETIAVEKAAKLRAKLLPFFKRNATGKLNNQPDESIFSVLQKQKGAEEIYQANTQMGMASTLDTELELHNIKSALSSKERELVEMSRELEETKAQLALVQAKATAEVAQAKQIALEKDVRLKSAGQAVANLKQVLVEYWGEGGRVELAGSFNGWKHFISMEPDPTSEISKPDGSRGPLMWETELWLYPGIYEIKFIVDGNWQIDQRREVMMRNSLHNNILRVEP